MLKYALSVFVVAALATPASAQVAYLSRTGSGSTCSSAAPCASMQTALTVAGAKGEVICLDKGYYGPALITQPISISCSDGWWEAGSVHVNTPAGSDVIIEGMVLDDHGFQGAAFLMDGQGALHLRRARVGNASGSTLGVDFEPNGPATLHVTDSVFYNNGGSGVLIKPQSGGSANVHIRHLRLEHNLHGLFVDGSNGTVNVNIAETAAVDNQQNGIGAFSPGSASVTVSVISSQITGNLANGIGSLGTGAGSVAVKIGNSQITGNVNGLSTGGTGQIVTLGGNHLHSNLSDGTFTGSILTR